MPLGFNLIIGPGIIQEEQFRPDICTHKNVDEDKCCDQEKYERCIQREAIDKIGTYHAYGLITYNCVTWASEVITECQQEACYQ